MSPTPTAHKTAPKPVRSFTSSTVHLLEAQLPPASTDLSAEAGGLGQGPLSLLEAGPVESQLLGWEGENPAGEAVVGFPQQPA